MVVQLAVDQCGHLRISSEHIYQRALALGVSVALCLVGCKDHGSGSAPAHAKPALASVAVLSEGVLSLYDSGARRVQTAVLGDVPAPTLRCWNTSALILSPHSWGRLDAGSSEAKLVWSKLSPKPEGCLNPTLQIRDAVPSKAGALCVTVTDGFSDTATCERTFTLDPMSGSYLPGRNDRKLVQQVGRILRRDPTDRNLPAVLITPPPFSPKDEWDAYLTFEVQIKLLGPQPFRNVLRL